MVPNETLRRPWVLAAAAVFGFLFFTVVAIVVDRLDASADEASSPPEMWRGIRVEPELDCQKRLYRRFAKSYDIYEDDDGLEERIIRRQGGAFSPYDLQSYDLGAADIEHIVSRKEAHESGLCTQGKAAIRSFSTSLGNLTIAGEHLNRVEKSDHDASVWMPEENQCWFAMTVANVKRTWNLSVDEAERDALERVLASCKSFEMVHP